MKPFIARQLVVLSLAITALLATACAFPFEALLPQEFVRGTGETQIEEMDLGNFTRVETGSAFEVTIQQGDMTRVVIEVDTALLPHLEVTTRGDTLHIGLARGISTLGNVVRRAEITLPALNQLTARGASSIEVTGFATQDRFVLGTSGASRVSGELFTGDLNVNQSGASQVQLQGTFGNIEMQLSGASRITLVGTGGEPIARETLSLRLSGASRATLDGAFDNVEMRLSGASRIAMSGRGVNLNVHATGSSQVDLQEFIVEDAEIRAESASTVTVHTTSRLLAEARSSATIHYAGSPDITNIQSSGSATIGPR